MKPVFAILTALAALAYAAPSAEADNSVGNIVDKRQYYSCTPCKNHKKTCASCGENGGCSYRETKC